MAARGRPAAWGLWLRLLPLAGLALGGVIISNIVPRTELGTSESIIDAHDGNVLFVDGLWHFYAAGYGECTEKPGPTGCAGGFVGCGFFCNHSVNLYTSPDLANDHWTFVGNVLPLAGHGRPNATLFCPKVVYNAASGLFVLWINYFPAYSYAVATSPTASGPFTVVSTTTGATTQYGAPNNTHVGDFSLFVDDDGTGYLAYSSSAHVQVERLTPDFQASDYWQTNATSGILPHGNEAPAMFKRNGRYYVLVSVSCCYCAGGGLVQAFGADHPLGPYTYLGEIASGPNPFNTSNITTSAQETTVFVVPGPAKLAAARRDGLALNLHVGAAEDDTFVWIGDRWQSAPDQLKGHDFTVWLPLAFDDTQPSAPVRHMAWADSFSLTTTN